MFSGMGVALLPLYSLNANHFPSYEQSPACHAVPYIYTCKYQTVLCAPFGGIWVWLGTCTVVYVQGVWSTINVHAHQCDRVAKTYPNKQLVGVYWKLVGFKPSQSAPEILNLSFSGCARTDQMGHSQALLFYRVPRWILDDLHGWLTSRYQCHQWY